ncbi:MAG: hypothetical protein IH610_11460 [Deltaproteobacteria bacterium]|nr:hypothetical protein [Deltaproteobacteria bacterium]
MAKRGVGDHAGALLCVAALLFAATDAHAAELEPRVYFNTPVGLNFLIAAYGYSEGGLSTNASSPIKDAQRQHRSIHPHRQRLQPRRDRLAIPLGRWAVTCHPLKDN